MKDSTYKIELWWEDARGVREAIKRLDARLPRAITTADLMELQEFMNNAISYYALDLINDYFDAGVEDIFGEELIYEEKEDE